MSSPGSEHAVTSPLEITHGEMNAAIDQGHAVPLSHSQDGSSGTATTGGSNGKTDGCESPTTTPPVTWTSSQSDSLRPAHSPRATPLSALVRGRPAWQTAIKWLASNAVSLASPHLRAGRAGATGRLPAMRAGTARPTEPARDGAIMTGQDEIQDWLSARAKATCWRYPHPESAPSERCRDDQLRQQADATRNAYQKDAPLRALCATDPYWQVLER
jgi:hypothetical protein